MEIFRFAILKQSVVCHLSCTPLGVRIGLFTPDRAFYQVCESQIGRLREPAIKLVDLVTQELIGTFKDGTAKVASWSALQLLSPLLPYLPT